MHDTTPFLILRLPDEFGVLVVFAVAHYFQDACKYVSLSSAVSLPFHLPIC